VVHQLFIELKEAYDSVSNEVLYNILTEFGITLKLVRRIKMYRHVPTAELGNASIFPVRNGLKQGNASSPL
jgi:hypothetical protein